MMNRRTALLAGTAGLAVLGTVGAGTYAVATGDRPEPVAPPALDAQGRLLWRNWSGIQHAYPVRRLAPKDEAELAVALRDAPTPVRAVGAGHSFTALAVTSGTLVSLDAMNGLVGWDAGDAIVWAGTRLGALGPLLAADGRAMANLPDINKQSLAGALATGTHGTGSKLKALHGDVTAISLCTADGQVIDINSRQQSDVFQAAKVSLGSLGILTQVRIKTTENRRIRRRVWLEPLEHALDQAESRWANHRNFELYAVPFTGLAVAISHDETDDPAEAREGASDDAFLGALKGLRNLLGFSTPLRKAAAKALLSGEQPQTSVDEGWKLLSTDRPIRFNEMEYHLPIEAQLPAFRQVMAVIEAKRPDVFFPIELRRIAGDDAWLSPFEGAPRGSVAVHAYYRDDFAFLYELVEPIFLRYGGRPHWGKLHSLQGDRLAALYPRWKDFLAVRRSLDPNGKFLNPYLNGLLGLS